MEVCRDHGTVLRQCRCPGPKTKHQLACPGPPECVPVNYRVRAVEADGALFVHLGDLIRYVQAADVPGEYREVVASFLHRLGENLEGV